MHADLLPQIRAHDSTRGGRGGINSRGNRSNFNSRSSQNSRRSSSAATFGGNRHAFGNNIPVGMGNYEYTAGGRLHDQLSRQYFELGVQQNALRAHLLAQAQAAQAQSQAQTQLQTANFTDSPHATSLVNGHSSPRNHENTPLNAPTLPGLVFHYPIPGDRSQPTAHASSQEGFRTNPSSPSLSASQPLVRTGSQRSTTTEGLQIGSIRSQSQPACVVSNQMLLQGYSLPPPHDASTLYQYPLTPAQSNVGLPLRPGPGLAIPGPITYYGSPKEYVGYSMGEPLQASPRSRSRHQDFTVAPIPSYADISQRRNRESSEPPQSLAPTAVRRASRSPSPLGQDRGYLAGLHSSPPPNAEFQRYGRIDSAQPAASNGPLIVNGSYPIVSSSTTASGTTADRAGLSMVGDVEPINIPTASYMRFHAGLRLDTGVTERSQLVTNGFVHSHAMTDDVRAAPQNNAPSYDSSNTDLTPDVVSSPYKPPLSALESTQDQPAVNGDREARHSPKPTGAPSIRSPTILSTPVSGPVPPLALSNGAAEPPTKTMTDSLPLLSPVAETPTQSPTAGRKRGGAAAFNANASNGTVLSSKTNTSRESQPQPETHNFKPSAADVGDKGKSHGSNGAAQANGWQRSGGKKATRGRARSGPEQRFAAGAGAKTRGEPLPVNEADRKGG